VVFAAVTDQLDAQGVTVKTGTLVNATLTASASITRDVEAFEIETECSYSFRVRDSKTHRVSDTVEVCGAKARECCFERLKPLR
jgi:hypothetical protein